MNKERKRERRWIGGWVKAQNDEDGIKGAREVHQKRRERLLKAGRKRTIYSEALRGREGK